MILLMSSVSFGSSFTPYGDKECETSDAKVLISVTKDSFEPRLIYVKEGDKVCMKVEAIDYSVSMTIDSHPVMLSVAPSKKPATAYFRANKVGEFNIKCRGGCALGVQPKLIVQSKADFEKFQEEQYRKDSEKYRQRVQPRQIQRDYKSDDPTFNRPTPLKNRFNR